MVEGNQPTIVVRHESANSENARRLVAAFIDDVAARLPNGFDPARSVSATADEMSPPNGDFLVLCQRDTEESMGCGGIKRLSAERVEIKRMWISPSARGMGLGRVLLAALERSAMDLGATEVVLDTHSTLREAAALYRSAGFEEIPPYNDNPYASLWMRKLLPGRSGERDRPRDE